MESLIYHLIFYQWQRKLLALFTATVIWFFVSYSITATKTVTSVPIRVINLPTDKTIQGLLPNGFLTKRASLTLTGTKKIIDQLEPGDVEIILDISHLPSSGIVQMNKKNLVSLNPNFNLPSHITAVTHPDLVIKMSPILTDKIPIMIHFPSGKPPKGYEFLDIWPVQLYQTISGPQDQILQLKNEGLELTFNLNDISKEQLDALHGEGLYDDEIHFDVPDQWKKVMIPLSNRGIEPINDPESEDLQLNFLRQQMIPMTNELSLDVFYPLKYQGTLNPKTYALAPTPFIQLKNDIPILKLSLFASHVSKLFLEVVKEYIQIGLVAAPLIERERLEWSINFINETHLEDTYVAFLLSNNKTSESHHNHQEREAHFRERFRTYIRRFGLYLSPEHPLELHSRLENGKIQVHIPDPLSSQQGQPHAD